ncbi:nucleotidyltransferase family protein [Actinomadura barringtoniae]|uniref:Nucleotidyltransferase family protein n=1 Tax=Actinomadura barringtoniae TaxID=1427535 RepID=A0A939PDE1_9ACTN|nr:nucleotidyltransferase family protein [Actinomadura barringtoniae]MBO2450555.1 nucleotidyltransferase family protein [Actinomadura barringtoniae]
MSEGVFVTGLVLAAGASRRLGRPKQLLPYGGRTLLDATLTMARSCGFDQLLVTLGGAATQVREVVDLSGCEPVDVPDYGTGCGSSIAHAMDAVDPRADAVVLLLGDQPGIDPEDVRRLRGPIGVCRYSGDELGHPFRFDREIFGDLRVLHGDKAVWKLLHSGRYAVNETPVDGPVPRDVDTDQDYQALLSGRPR